jgi:hypothetical protein
MRMQKKRTTTTKILWIILLILLGRNCRAINSPIQMFLDNCKISQSSQVRIEAALLRITPSTNSRRNPRDGTHFVTRQRKHRDNRLIRKRLHQAEIRLRGQQSILLVIQRLMESARQHPTPDNRHIIIQRRCNPEAIERHQAVSVSQLALGYQLFLTTQHLNHRDMDRSHFKQDMVNQLSHTAGPYRIPGVSVDLQLLNLEALGSHHHARKSDQHYARRGRS